MSLLHGDARGALAGLDASSVDSVVTDPPYELGFMGKAWDGTGIAYSVDLWREVLRVLKPGGHLLAFGGTRTYHRMTVAIEDAGFEIRDSLHWLYGTGFPKSLNVGKAIDDVRGSVREVIGSGVADDIRGGNMHAANRGQKHEIEITQGSSEWEGWGTALKPGHEPIVLARKPLEGTVANNVQKHGTGGLNIDGCRIETSDNLNGGAYSSESTKKAEDASTFLLGTAGREFKQPEGRWPANVLLSHGLFCWPRRENDYLCPICGEVRKSGECRDCDLQRGRCQTGCPVAELDAQSGPLKSGGANGHRSASENIAMSGPNTERTTTNGRLPDSGGASRFFYVAKPSRKERDLGCEHLPARTGGEATDREDGSAGVDNPRAGAGRTGGARNYHPTVKPIQLMRYLVRLVTPPGGLVLDPFTGSGTTGIACELEGFGFLGIEADAAYVAIARRRISHAMPLFAEAAP